MHDIKENGIPEVFQYIAKQVPDAVVVFDSYGKVLYTNQAATRMYGYSGGEFQKLFFQDLYPLKEKYRIDEHSKATDHVFLGSVHVKRDGTLFPVQIELGKALLGEMEVLVSIVREIDKKSEGDALKSNEKKYQLLHEELLAAYEELTASEEELRQQVDELLEKERKIYRQNTVLNLLHDIVIDLMANIKDDDIFKKIVAGVVELFDAPNTFVHVIDEKKGTYTVKTGTGIFTQLVDEVYITKGLVGQAYRTGKIAAASHYSVWEDRLPHSIFDAIDYYVVVPLKQQGRMFGAIGLAFSEAGRILSQDELFLLQRFADLASIALGNAQLVTFLHNEVKGHEYAEKQLKQSEERFSTAFYLSPDAIAISRPDGTYVEVNQGFVRMSGFSAAEVIGGNAVDLGIWLDIHDRERMTAEQKKHGEVRDMEAPFRRKDGRIVYGQISACMLTLNGELHYMVVIRDITARLQAEKARRKSEQALLDSKNKLSIAAGLANLGPWEYDPKTGLFEFSDEFYAVYDTSVARESLYMTWEAYAGEFVYPKDLWMFKDAKKFLASGSNLCRTGDIMHRIIRRDGEVRTVLVRSRHVKDDAGKVIKIYGTNQDITERMRLEEKRREQEENIRHMAYSDSLTNLANRNHLNEWLKDELERARHGQTAGFVIFIDLDNLKMVNDTYGHTYGDGIIVEAGNRILNIVGNETFVARVGGDEFVVILPGSYDHKEITGLVQQLSETLGKTQELFGTHFHLTASIGIASYPADGDTVDEIIKNADNAMYAAKKGGKNCWRFYRKKMQSEIYEKVRLIEGLRSALSRDEFYVVYQPQIDAVNKKIVGFEALLRWQSAEHGIVSPMQFIPIAEESGLIQSIGNWVLQEACQFSRRLADQGWGGVKVAVNISPKQIATDHFIVDVQNAIGEAGIQSHQLELEITENLLMTSLEDATNKLIQLRGLGVHLSLDDFGTGFSSLTYLRRLPVETLKIDKSFIDMIAMDDNGAKIIGSIISMAHTINLNVVAEGVETEKQLEYLIAKGCDCIQGYIFSQPVSEEAARRLLDRKS